MTASVEPLVATNFSFLTGASHPEELVAAAKDLGLAAIGVADRNSLAGAVRMHVAAVTAGVRLVVGARLVFCDGTRTSRSIPRTGRPTAGSAGCSPRATGARPRANA